MWKCLRKCSSWHSVKESLTTKIPKITGDNQLSESMADQQINRSIIHFEAQSKTKLPFVFTFVMFRSDLIGAGEPALIDTSVKNSPGEQKIKKLPTYPSMHPVSEVPPSIKWKWCFKYTNNLHFVVCCCFCCRLFLFTSLIHLPSTLKIKLMLLTK